MNQYSTETRRVCVRVDRKQGSTQEILSARNDKEGVVRLYVVNGLRDDRASVMNAMIIGIPKDLPLKLNVIHGPKEKSTTLTFL